jgi:hypothetical protein
MALSRACCLDFQSFGELPRLFFAFLYLCELVVGGTFFSRRLSHCRCFVCL